MLRNRKLCFIKEERGSLGALYDKNDELKNDWNHNVEADIFSSFGVHPLRMPTSSSSTLNVGLAVAEEANA